MGLNFGQTFTNQTTLTIPAATHGLGHAALRLAIYDAGTPRQRLRPLVRVDPTTFDITATFLQTQSGLLVAQGATPPIGPLGNKRITFSLPAGGSFVVPGTQHGYGTDHLLIDVFDNSTPNIWLPDVPVSVHPTTFDVTVSALQALSGTIILSAAADTGTANAALPIALPSGGTLTIPATTHGLTASSLGVQLFDTQGVEVIPGRVSLDPVTLALAVTTLQAFTGTLIVNSSVASVSGQRMVIAKGGTLLLGGASMGQTGTALERTTGYYSFTFEDEANQGVDAAVIETLTLTYYDTASGQVINGRLHQNVRNANQGQLVMSVGPPLVTTFSFEFLPIDGVILDQSHASETRSMLFQWTWAGGQRAGARTVSFAVSNLSFVP